MKLRRASNVAPRKWRCSWLSVILFLVVAMMVYQFSLVSPSLQEGLLAGHNIIQSSLLETHWRLPDIIITEAAAQNFTYQYQTDSKEIPLVLVPKNKSRNVRFLFGIMSYDHAIELRRRNQIRNTYLSYYRQFTDTPHKICALADLIEATTRNTTDKNSKSSILLENCELAYTFVVGANPDGPTQLLEFNESYPIAIDHEKIQKPERDVVYLNIKENGKFGKSPTWFKYGLEVMKNYPQLYWDYIVKTDRLVLAQNPGV